VLVADEHREAVQDWLASGGAAWRAALEPLTPMQRRVVVDTLQAFYEQSLTTGADGDGDAASDGDPDDPDDHVSGDGGPGGDAASATH
jgi:hypothetical protein